LLPGRLNLDRVAALHPDNPEIDRLKDLVEGMRVPVAPGFKPNGHMPGQEPLRRKYTDTKGAVDELNMSGAKADGLAFVFRESALEKIENVQFSALSWTGKKGKVSGRGINDCSSAGPGQPLNSLEAVDAAKAMWGEIEHPTVAELVATIIESKNRLMKNKGMTSEQAWAALILWKTDLRVAFTLLFFRPEHA
jgi:hypothetical protein